MLKSSWLFIIIGALPISATPENLVPEKLLRILNVAFMGKNAEIKKSGHYSWIEFCPDNTCEVIRTKAIEADKRLTILATGYFLYVSKYSYLEGWQKEINNKEAFIRLVRQASIKNCKDSSEKELVTCVLKEINSELSGELLFIRFDEGHVSSQKLDLKKEMEVRFQEPSIN